MLTAAGAAGGCFAGAARCLDGSVLGTGSYRQRFHHRSDAGPDQCQAGAAITVPAIKVGTLLFDKNGALNPQAMALLPNPQTLPFNISLPIFPDTGAQQPMVVSTTFDKTTQYGSVTNDLGSVQNGYSAGSWQRYAIDENGVILGQYSNGKSRAMGRSVWPTSPAWMA
jgi:flagellar hook protein FlgE